MSYFKNKEALVQFVEDTIQSLNKNSVLTMTIVPGQFGDYSARTVIDELLADTASKVAQSSSKQPTNT